MTMLFYFAGDTFELHAMKTNWTRFELGGVYRLRETFNNKPAPEHIVTDNIDDLRRVMCRNRCYVNEEALRARLADLKDGDTIDLTVTPIR